MSWSRHVLLVLGAACASDYGLGRKGDDNDGDNEGGVVPGTDTAVLTPAWCVEPDGLPVSVPADESCTLTPVDGPLDAVLEWEMRTFGNYGEYSQLLTPPMVGNLTDDNGDGTVGRDDLPDIVFVADDDGERPHQKGILRIIPGDGSNPGLAIQRIDTTVDGETLQIYPYRYGNVALGDVDLDGTPEIVAIVQPVTGGGGDGGGGGSDVGSGGGEDGGGDDGGGEVPVSGFAPCTLAAIRPDGTLLWVSQGADFDCGGHAPALADLEGDGDVEVVLGALVVDGLDGRFVWRGDGGAGSFPWHPETGTLSVPVDLDGDGQLEVVTGSTIYAADGTARCGTGAPEDDGFIAVADLDADGRGEIVSVGNATVRVLEDDCTEARRWSLSGGGNGGPPTIGDFDGDGAPEIGIAAAASYAVYEADGRVVWAMPVDDASSHSTGSAVFDFEGDGRAEVVYADESTLWVFDGSTGEVRLADNRHASRTLHEYPTIADVDGDGESEIIVPCGGGHEDERSNGFYVLGGAQGWASSRPVWNQHAYSITHIDDNLRVVSPTPSNWPTYNTFRSGDLTPAGGGGSPDAVPAVEPCLEECPNDRLVVFVRVGNSGAGGLRSGVPVSVYADDGTRELLATVWTSEVVAETAVSSTLRVTLPREGLRDRDLLVIVDDDGGTGWVEECTENNNIARIPAAELACP
jgi:hypothetical protein